MYVVMEIQFSLAGIMNNKHNIAHFLHEINFQILFLDFMCKLPA